LGCPAYVVVHNHNRTRLEPDEIGIGAISLSSKNAKMKSLTGAATDLHNKRLLRQEVGISVTIGWGHMRILKVVR
jgi:hypothetical protein